MTKHNAPAVVFPIRHLRSHQWFLWGLWSGGPALMLLWYLSTMRLDWRIGLGCVAVSVSAWKLLTVWHNDSAGDLNWNGNCWRWECVTSSAVHGELTLSVVVDFQQFLLVVANENTGYRFWLCAERGAFPERWLDLRRAVYSSSKMADGQAEVNYVAS